MNPYLLLKDICKRVEPDCEVVLTNETYNDYLTSHYTAKWICCMFSDYTENISMLAKANVAQSNFRATILFIAKDEKHNLDHSEEDISQSSIHICENMKTIASRVLRQFQYELQAQSTPSPTWKQSLIIRETSNFYSGCKNEISFVYSPIIQCIPKS